MWWLVEVSSLPCLSYQRPAMRSPRWQPHWQMRASPELLWKRDTASRRYPQWASARVGAEAVAATFAPSTLQPEEGRLGHWLQRRSPTGPFERLAEAGSQGN